MGEMQEGAALPAQTNVRWYKVVSPTIEKPVKCILLSDRFTGYWTHWDGRVYPCSFDHSCIRCKKGQPNRWLAYIAAYDIYRRERIVVHLTEGAARQLLVLGERNKGLRGLGVELRRVYVSKNNSKVNVYPIAVQTPMDFLPEHPVSDSVNRLFGINEEWAKQFVGGQVAVGPDARTQGAGLPRRAPEEPTEAEQWRM